MSVTRGAARPRRALGAALAILIATGTLLPSTARADDAKTITGVLTAALDLFDDEKGSFACTVDTRALSAKPPSREIPADERCAADRGEALVSALDQGGIRVLRASGTGLLQIPLGGRTYWVDSSAVDLAIDVGSAPSRRCLEFAKLTPRAQDQMIARGGGEDPCSPSKSKQSPGSKK